MVNEQGLASYCQDCGLCAAAADGPPAGTESDLARIIAGEIIKTVPGRRTDAAEEKKIPLGVSNRHAHLTETTFRELFGPDALLEKYRDLYQAGEFASRQTITIAGNKMRAIQNLRILGPFRSYDQVELSLTDAIQLGINPPVRNSGDLEAAAPLTLVGPRRSVYIENCAIVAGRHIHMSGQDAVVFGVADGDRCKVRIGGEKGIIFENVLVRINDAWNLHLHLDTDDANAANVRCNMSAEFIGKMEA